MLKIFPGKIIYSRIFIAFFFYCRGEKIVLVIHLKMDSKNLGFVSASLVSLFLGTESMLGPLRHATAPSNDMLYEWYCYQESWRDDLQ